HKAFFFDRKTGTLSIPINSDAKSLKNISSAKIIAPEYNRWNGFYVYDLNSSEGFNLKGTITHSAEDNRYYGMSNARTFYINDVLYTASTDYLKMNDMDDLKGINAIKLENTGKFIDYLEEEIIR
ncbi:MAG: copper amine oxidase, partial [Nitrosopumilus sp.]|nr:copper amine oxidase [Nitrosopumilus sp.]